MEVIIRPTQEAAAMLTARLIQQELQQRPHTVLGLATGRTMQRLYERLGELHRTEGLDFSLCRTFNLDEYVGLPPSDPNSYRYYMTHWLFSKVNIDLRNTHLPDGLAPDLEAECLRYEALMDDCGGIDLQLLGLGRSGHMGFNEPLSALQSCTRAIALTPLTIAENSTLFDDPTRMPKRAITMGVGTILKSRRILLLVTGTSKAEILAKAVEGPVTSMVSASALQLHSHCTVICDEAAAAGLQGSEYYHWIFANEPHWQAFQD